jgi:hypothetical protein
LDKMLTRPIPTNKLGMVVGIGKRISLKLVPEQKTQN